MADETWTVMVYLAGDNNLTDECVYALTEMKKVGSGAHLNIFAQFDPKDNYLETHRYKIKKGVEPGLLPDDITEKAPFNDTAKSPLAKPIAPQRPEDAEQVGETDTGDPRTLFNFIVSCIVDSPADHYMVVLAGHGSGTDRDFLLKDDSPVGYLTMRELQGVFQDVKENFRDKNGNPLVIDILGMDVCLMSMAEVCYELKDLVQIVVGCESYSPASGWPYRPILQRLEPGIAPVDFAKAIVDEYVNFYADYWLGGLSVDQAALNMGEIEGLKDVVASLATALKGELTTVATQQKFKDAIILAHWETQSYNGERFIDLFDFCNCLKERYGDNGIPQVCDDVMSFISQNLVLNSCYSGPLYQYSHGVSIYFPWADVTPFYRSLAFASDSGWVQFLEKYVEITRRPMRPPEGFQTPTNFFLANTVQPQPFRQVGGKGPENPIYSMRNPPIAALPSKCVRAKQEAISGAEKVFGLDQ